MTIKELQTAMIAAMKAKEKARKDTISSLIAAVKKSAIDAGCRDDIPEEMVDSVILKELKTAKEQVDTCPADRTELLEEYNAKVAVIKEFAPKQMDADEIKAVITEKFADVIATGNKGLIMKSVMGELKGKADGKLINQIVSELCK
ncbi:MAG: GatB/YqeY domain-containing protein [Clostridiales bacterium]|nr:GatB/YqeY domain-containing protein [Clostridiales bacterium]